MIALQLPPAVAQILRSLPNATRMHRSMAIGFVFVAAGLMVYRSVDSPRGALRRFSANYVAKIDASQRAMFIAPNGAMVGWLQLAAITAVLIVYGLLFQNVLLAVAGMIAILPPVMIRNKMLARRARIDDQAHGFALALANALKSTSSIGDALKGATDVTDNPLKNELGTAQRQIRVGSTLEEALLALSARVGSNALDVVVSALLIGRQTGGDLPRILEGTASSLRDLKRLEQLTDKVTRDAKISVSIGALLTVGMAIGIPQVFPGFLDPLKNTWKGQVIAMQMTGAFVFALYLAYRVTRKSI